MQGESTRKEQLKSFVYDLDKILLGTFEPYWTEWQGNAGILRNEVKELRDKLEGKLNQ
tara:strand:- start:411 stop:584 length:174 start_codon:yes stop_codon:yes gene_type:complete